MTELRLLTVLTPLLLTVKITANEATYHVSTVEKMGEGGGSGVCAFSFEEIVTKDETSYLTRAQKLENEA